MLDSKFKNISSKTIATNELTLRANIYVIIIIKIEKF